MADPPTIVKFGRTTLFLLVTASPGAAVLFFTAVSSPEQPPFSYIPHTS